MTSRAAAGEKIILALDRPRLEDALVLADALPDLLWVKVGLELFTGEGPRAIQVMKDRGKKVFLDLKLHDIPNTVAGAVRSASQMGADLLTVHASGGPKMMAEAARVRDSFPNAPRLVAVTVLTSLDGTEFPEVYRSPEVAERVQVFAKEAQRAGMNGIVCSPQELEVVSSVVTREFLRVTPGVRPAGAALHDQARVATPGAAVARGASHLVIGRALTEAANPAEAWESLLDELESVETLDQA